MNPDMINQAMDANTYANLIDTLGFPIVSVLACGALLFFIIRFLLKNIGSELSELSSGQIEFINDARKLDNDLIRLTTKMRTIRALRASGQLPSKQKPQ